ncbi:FKBP-type peptidyl-prolyl cis-trans isomerase [Demequina capsici]|uniref:peptidylprolyl isomerase n=1 Tax=Demequina capsici TaxID=3075620 RepID=A0AA96F6K9_9MICO|nr:FKBP-type peptidyl-prolyl cis-trans isomerase [Demequina sp. OYTSA14]WNM25011.1 FKBP-type peptidyl-prolyl cis-trans isomerase [Demequina sp. OYTSA14]
MNFRRPAAAAAILATAALGLAACSSDTSSDPSASTSASTDTAAATAATVAALETVTWTDGSDGVPVLTFDDGGTYAFTATGAVLNKDGDGEAIADGTGVSVSYVIYDVPSASSASDSASASASPSASASASATSTEPALYYSTYDDNYTELLTVSSSALDPVLYDILNGAHVGAQVLYGTIDSSTGDSLIMAVTVEKTTPLRATGTSIEPLAGLPTVTLADNGAPTIDMSTATSEPTDLVVQTLIQGDGAAVAEGQTLTVQYTGWLWDGTQFDSSWDRGYASSFTLSADSLIQGWVDGLTGVQVGSQVMLIVPPDLAYGSDGSGTTIPADATLVFVIDVLDAQ